MPVQKGPADGNAMNDAGLPGMAVTPGGAVVRIEDKGKKRRDRWH